MAPKRGTSGRWTIWILFAAGLLVVLGLVYFFRPMTPAPAVASQPTQHPSMFFSQDDVSRLRNQAQTTHSEIWQPILAFAQSQLGSTPPEPPAEGDLDGYRNAGNELIAFAFAYVITGDQAYLDLTRRYMLAYSQWRYWGDDGGYGNRDLGFHHMLMGNAIAYDWTYDGLSEADRNTIRSNLVQRTQESYEASSSANYRWNNWWRRAYTQNHNWIIHSALGIAALVLTGEDSRASQWLEEAVQDVTRIRYLLEGVGDGSWHEGIPYQDYALSMSLPFLYNLNRLKGEDLIPHTYLRNYVSWMVYNSLPNSGRFVLSYGDMEWSWANAYGPQGLLRFMAAEYGDGHAEWLAQSMIQHEGRVASIYTTPWYVFEFLYYDPSVKPQAPDDLSPDRTFPDLEGVIWRTGWSDGDLVFGLKTGAIGGRFAYTAFTSDKQYPFDPKSDVDLFHTAHDHDDANSFYLYRGNVDLTSETTGYGYTATYFHNTLLVDGRGQYRVPESNPNYGHDPALVAETDGSLVDVYGSKDFSFLVADATNPYRYADPRTGYPGSRMLEEFKRHVLFVKPGYLLMVDSVRSSSSHQFAWVSHFAKSASIEGDWVKGIAEGGQVLGIKIVAPANFDPLAGNDGQPFLQIRTAAAVRDTRFVTVLYPTSEAGWQARPVISSLGDDGQATGVRVLLDGTQDHLIRYGGQNASRVGEYLFDGQSASISRTAEGSLRRIFLGQASSLADGHGARALVQAPRRLSALQVDYVNEGLSVYGEDLEGVRIYAPQVSVGHVTVNGKSVAASRVGDYIVIGPATP